MLGKSFNAVALVFHAGFQAICHVFLTNEDLRTQNTLDLPSGND
jgi:hypothetical protein